MICVIDNYDSFVYNLVQYLGALTGCEIQVFRNDAISVPALKGLNPNAIVLSPGPCTPNEAGICLEVVDQLATSIPLLGVCLGHQTIAAAYGGNVVRAQEVIHGKVSQIKHDSRAIFQNVDDPFTATRYHSLIVERESMPSCLEVSAWTDDGVVMGIRHKELNVHGLQFHPESILTDKGKVILRNFLDLAEAG